MTYSFKISFLVSCLSILNLDIGLSQASSGESILLEISSQIKTSADDAEEYLKNGTVILNSSDLEIVDDKEEGAQIVGLRFMELPLSKGMDVQSAYIQFTADTEISWGATEITISGELSERAAPFENQITNLSSRVLTNTKVKWQAEEWLVTSEQSSKQQTVDLTPIIKEIIQQPNWQGGNELAFFLTGSGRRRTAAAYDLAPQQAATLVVNFNYTKPNTVLENISINEIMAANSTIFDENGDADDWLEIYNGNDVPILLDDLYLTDDLTDLRKWQIKDQTILPPNGYALIWADGEPEQGNLHAPFKLKSSGESLALVQKLDGALHVLDSLTFPSLPKNTSYGRKTDGQNEWTLFTEVSPKTSNNGKGEYTTAKVQFSQESGIYEEVITLEIAVDDPSYDIYYTVDGSIPTNQSILYQTPIALNQAQQISARAIKNDFMGGIETAFYVVNDPSEIAILNVQSNPDNFWDDEMGIYVKGTNGALDYCDNVLNNWNQDWERPCQLTFYEPDGTSGFQVNAGMKIGGACSRNLAQKSLNFYMRNGRYGDKSIQYKIFANLEIAEFRRIKIRNSGGDWQEMLFRDGMNQTILANQVDIDLMAYRPVRVYLNGEFWGIYGMRELFNEDYIESHHGVDKDSVDILGDPSGPRANVKEGSFDAYTQMINYIEQHGLKEKVHYENIQERMDVNEFINYYITQIYLANFDWPGNNVRVWRDQNGGKFRWMLFDTDASTGWQSWGPNVAKPNHNSLTHSLNTGSVNMAVPGFTEWPNGASSTYLFRKLMENENFKSEFIQRTGTFRTLIFNPERVLPMVDNMESLLAPEMNRHIQTWSKLDRKILGNGSPSGGSITNWQSTISAYKRFFSDRPFHILSTYRNTLDLTGDFQLKFDYTETTKGKVVLHENEMAIPFDYEGTYFKNIPIQIKAIPAEGYVFSHWLETGDTSAEIDFTANEDATLTPIFVDQLVSTEDLENISRLTIFPNPAKDIIQLNMDNLTTKVTEIRVYNSVGQVVLMQNITANGGVLNEHISIGHLSEGVYWVEVLDANNHRLAQRLVIN